MKDRPAADVYVTPHPWAMMHKRRYGNVETYKLAAAWLAPCRTVADWGGGGGMFKDYLPAGTDYVNVDGTKQRGVDVVADLTAYRKRSEGILLRHVVDNTPEPYAVLANAMAHCDRRLVVVTYTPHATPAVVVEYQYGWPVWNLDHNVLATFMGPALREIRVVPNNDGISEEKLFLLEHATP